LLVIVGGALGAPGVRRMPGPGEKRFKCYSAGRAADRGPCQGGLRDGVWTLAVEHLADAAGELGEAERLGHQLDAGVEPAFMDDGVAGVAGGVKQLEAGP
jgi:hypothetical protein